MNNYPSENNMAGNNSPMSSRSIESSSVSPASSYNNDYYATYQNSLPVYYNGQILWEMNGRRNDMWMNEGRMEYMQHIQATTQQRPGITQQAPAIMQQAPAIMQQAPAIVQQIPATMQRAQATTQQAQATTQRAQATMQQAQATEQRSGVPTVARRNLSSAKGIYLEIYLFL